MENNKSSLAIFWSILIGLLINGLLVGAKLIIEETELGHRFEIFTYEILHSPLSSFKREERLSVLVVDRNKIPHCNDQPTPREPLKKMIEAIAMHQPAAIALDIDFSPDEYGWRTDEDPEFFDFCQQITEEKHIPIFLGVYRSIGAGSDTWLGLSKYKDMAVSLGLPKREKPWRVPRWMEVEGSQEQLPTLCAALAHGLKTDLPAPARILTWAIEKASDCQPGIEEPVGNGLKVANFLVNYSKLEQIQHEMISTTKEGLIVEPRERFLNKIIIIGTATDFTDPFVVPGHNLAIAGVYIHACAAYTLAAEPLYEFKQSVRLLLDFAISLIIILSATVIRVRHKDMDDAKLHKWQTRFLIKAVMVVIIGGILMVQWLNIMWLDFLLVVCALLLHRPVEVRLNRWLKR